MLVVMDERERPVNEVIPKARRMIRIPPRRPAFPMI